MGSAGDKALARVVPRGSATMASIEKSESANDSPEGKRVYRFWVELRDRLCYEVGRAWER